MNWTEVAGEIVIPVVAIATAGLCYLAWRQAKKNREIDQACREILDDSKVVLIQIPGFPHEAEDHRIVPIQIPGYSENKLSRSNVLPA